MNRKNAYTIDEDDFIKSNYKSMTTKEIADLLGRTKNGIRARASKLGLRKNNSIIGFNEIKSDEYCEPEIWIDIEGYEGIYKVSNYGRVLSVERKDRSGFLRNSKILTQEKTKRGYYRVRLSKDMETKKFSVHTLVGNAFVPNPNNFNLINHKDENPENNFYKNLEWCSHKYNLNYGNHNKKVAKTKGRSVLQYDLKGNLIKKYCSVGEASKETGLNYKQIYRCCSEIRKRKDGTSNHIYGNYYWEYNEKTKKSVRPVIQYDLEMNELARYNSAADAAKAIGVKPYGIKDCCKGLSKTSHGYKWRYQYEIQDKSC